MSILDTFGEEIVQDLRAQLAKYNRNASGALSKSLRYETLEDSEKIRILVYGNSYIEQLEKGRKPTVQGGGEPFTVQMIVDWIRVKRIQFSGKIESVAYLIWRKINRDGYEGTPNLITDVLEGKAQEIADFLGKKYIEISTKTILDYV